MQIQWWQILLISIYAFVQINEKITLNIGLGEPLITGMFTGLIMGDLKLGLAIGATLQLMVLGVGTFGGASIPDFTTGAIVGTVVGVLSGKGMEFAIGVAVPVGLLMVQLDILARFTNTFFLHRVDRSIEEGNIKGITRNVLAGSIPWGLSRMLPVLLVLIFGQSMVNSVIELTPDWLMGGLKVAGGVLPAVGIGILLRYLPAKRFISYLIIGFIAAAYVKIPMMGVALLGLAFAIIQYKKIIDEAELEKKFNDRTAQSVIEGQEGEIDDDEF